jgi:uncharacterized protein YndB with AHSA1/START domain
VVVAEWAKINNVSSAAVAAKTGKGWDEWLSILDAAGAREMSHPEIARLLKEQHGVPDWWCQMVTVGYEQARGLREVYQKADGYSASGSRTVAVPVTKLFGAWANEAERAHWLGDAHLEIRKATAGKSIRARWSDGTSVEINFYSKTDNKSQVALQHSLLADAESVGEMKGFWREALDRLKVYLESESELSG